MSYLNNFDFNKRLLEIRGLRFAFVVQRIEMLLIRQLFVEIQKLFALRIELGELEGSSFAKSLEIIAIRPRKENFLHYDRRKMLFNRVQLLHEIL